MRQPKTAPAQLEPVRITRARAHKVAVGTRRPRATVAPPEAPSPVPFVAETKPFANAPVGTTFDDGAQLRAELAGRVKSSQPERSMNRIRNSDAQILERNSGDFCRKNLVSERLSGTADASWFHGMHDHQDAVNVASKTPGKGQCSRRDQRALETSPVQASTFVPWPRTSTDPPSPPPPAITEELVRAIERQDKYAPPALPLPPAAQSFVDALEAWRQKLAKHFGHSTSSFHSNMRRAAARIRQRLQFLPKERRERIMEIIEHGYTIPFSSTPPPFHRAANSPDLSLYKEEAWAALLKDISHGAARPCDLIVEGKPKVVSPVRTAPKGWRSKERRFVVNMRYLNSFIPDEHAKCKLDTQPRIRNIYFFPPWYREDPFGMTMDLSSGYHNVWLNPKQHTYMGIAIHASDLPAEAIEYLRARYPSCEDANGCFYFLMTALPFGLAPSCAVFSDIITALCAGWRRHKVVGMPVRLTSYVDDMMSAMLGVRRTLITAVELVYEASAAGLTLQVPKCRLNPATKLLFLGLIVDMVKKRFSLPQKRVQRLTIQTQELLHSATHFDIVEARQVAQFVGLLWAAAPACPRAVAILARGLIQMLTNALRHTVYDPVTAQTIPEHAHGAPSASLRRILATFWDGSIPWTPNAREDIRFWATVDYARLSAPISADTFELAVRGAQIDTSHINTDGVAFIASDASEVACGGGQVIQVANNAFSFQGSRRFVSELPRRLLGKSSTIREANTILWLLRSLLPGLPSRVIAFTDSMAASKAIVRGSRAPELQAVVRELFVLCLRHGITLIPCWMPRSHPVIQEADRLSRIRDVYGARTPAPVFARAQHLALVHWGTPISFDRQASHINVMPPPGWGPPLPFHSRWLQPGSHGVDMFLQPRRSWMQHVNFIHPAEPTLPRVVTFLPQTCARSIVVFPEGRQHSQWWSSWVSDDGPGVVTTEVVAGFRIVVVDHSPRSDQPPPAPTTRTCSSYTNKTDARVHAHCRTNTRLET